MDAIGVASPQNLLFKVGGVLFFCVKNLKKGQDGQMDKKLFC